MDRPVTAGHRRRAAAVTGAAVAVVLLAAACVAGAVKAVGALDGVADKQCTTAPEDLLDRVAADPVLTADVPGTEVTARRRANPCDPGQESRASVTVVRTLTAGTGWADVRARYETLLAAQGWTVAPAGDVLCGTRQVDGRIVAFDLRQAAAPTAVEATIRFWGTTRDTSC